MQQIFTTENTKDEIFVLLIKKSHKAIFKLKVVDDITQHIKLINTIDTFFFILWLYSTFEINRIRQVPDNDTKKRVILSLSYSFYRTELLKMFHSTCLLIGFYILIRYPVSMSKRRTPKYI